MFISLLVHSWDMVFCLLFQSMVLVSSTQYLDEVGFSQKLYFT